LQIDPEPARTSAQNEHEVRRARFVESLDEAPTRGYVVFLIFKAACRTLVRIVRSVVYGC
jgi:hypothetical protein